METRVDCYGLKVTRSVKGDREIYRRSDGLEVAYPVGRGWGRAMQVIEAHIPAGHPAALTTEGPATAG
jgi:hypothetical protein